MSYVCLEASRTCEARRVPAIGPWPAFFAGLGLQERFDASNNPVVNSFWERDDVVTSFQGAPLDSTEGPKVLLLSLQDAASGTNLTRASLRIIVTTYLSRP